MAKDLAEEEIRDTNTHTYAITNRGDEKSVFQYANNLDAEVTVELYGTYSDDDFSDELKLGSNTISKNTVESGSLSDPWDKVRIKVTASTTPSSGTFIAKKHEE